MKIRTVRYIIKEGFINSYRNKLMSLASISVVIASLIVFGMFFLITANLNYNMSIFKDKPEIKVFCDYKLDDAQVKNVEDAIKKNEKIQDYNTVSKKEAFEEAKTMLGNDNSALEGLDESFLPISFIVKLKNPADGTFVMEQLKSIKGIDKVSYPQKRIETFSRISYWGQLVSGILVVILLIISMFIIANTIKLTVFARRKEINIMKYIGATDWFIRWPFVVEGAVIGFIGAIISFVLIGYIYNFAGNKLGEVFQGIMFIKLNQIGLSIVGIFSLIGIGIGSVGSVMSIRKYLQV